MEVSVYIQSDLFKRKTMTFYKKQIIGFVFVLVGCLLSSSSFAQVLTPGTFEKDYFRDYSIMNPDCLTYINNLNSIQYKADCLSQNSTRDSLSSPNKYIQILGSKADVIYSSTYPRSYNDGPLWIGKGTTIVFNGGVQAKWGVLDLTINPLAYYSFNESFDLVSNENKDPFSYPYHGNIDYVVRYGDDPFFKIFPGQSDVSLNFSSVRFGVSTQNFQWGPSRYNPIIMSSQAPGIPHVYIETDDPIPTKIGEFELKQFWGELAESDYFDGIEDNDRRYITGMSFGYRPKWVKGLNLGFNRVLYKDWGDLNTKDIFITTFRFNPPPSAEPGGQNDDFDQIASVSARWTFPEVGFESYFEFARNDFGGAIFGLQPEHSRAFTLGFTKLFDLINNHTLSVTGEHTTLGQSRSVLVRPTPTYYVHSVVVQGYTHHGQILGAGIGPGSHSNILHLKLYADQSMHGIRIQTIRFDDDYYYATFDDRLHHDVEFSAQYEGEVKLDKYKLGLNVTYSRRSNWYFDRDRDVNNVYLGLSFSF